MVTPWLLGAGIIMAALAALAGLTDVIGEERIRSLADAWWHAGGNVIVVLIEILQLVLALRTGRRGYRAEGPHSLAGGHLHSLVHRLERLGDGLSSSRRCSR
jgi:uncharacterized membrane protein